LFLKRLEVFGFKSFAERLEITFAPGITAIVGPNGSGKSNVGDAVRWVLGEQNARHLRGSQMADVIFGGTESRKPLSFCEVSLVFDNESNDLNLDYIEVAITRRLYRSGESEYYINKTACRLKDIIELFQDTGIGKEGYSIIGQGRIDNILSSRSEERRAIFEEAAGIVKYKTRKNEAERKMEHTCANLIRINDIVSELELRIEPLSQQAEVAKEYLALRESLRDLEVNMYLCQSEMATERKANQAKTLVGIEEEAEEKNKLVSVLEQESSFEQTQVQEIEQALSVIRSNILELTSRLEKGAGEQNVIQEKIANVEAEVMRLNDELIANAQLKDAMQATLSGDNNAAMQKKEEILQRQNNIGTMEEELQSFDVQLALDGEELDKVKSEIMSTLNRLSDVKANLGRYETMRANIVSRCDLINNQKDTLVIQNQNILDATSAQKVITDKYLANKQELLNQKEAHLS